MKKVMLFKFALAAALSLSPVLAKANVLSDRMFSFAGQSLFMGDRLYSGDQRYYIEMQSDCNLVIYQSAYAGQAYPLWDTKTQGRARRCRATMQTDGNFVLYRIDEYYPGPGGRPQMHETAMFNSGTQGNFQAVLVMQTDGNLVIYDRYDLRRPIWNTGTQEEARRPHGPPGPGPGPGPRPGGPGRR